MDESEKAESDLDLIAALVQDLVERSRATGSMIVVPANHKLNEVLARVIARKEKELNAYKFN